MKRIQHLFYLILIVAFSCIEEDRMPTISLCAIGKITYTSAEVTGIVEFQGTENFVARGFCYSKERNVSMNDYVAVSSDTGNIFSLTIDSLLPNTKYYLKAFATNLHTTTLSALDSFQTLALQVPTLVTHPADEVTQTSAILQGEIIETGGAGILECGICYATNPKPELTDNVLKISAIEELFHIEVYGLNPSTTYYVRAYAISEEGVGFGEAISFKTMSPGLPMVAMDSIFNIGSMYATGHAHVDEDGGAPVTERGICWSKNTNPTISDFKKPSGAGNGKFWAALTELNSGTTYYAAAYAINSTGVAYSEKVSFRTAATTVTYTLYKSANPTTNEIEMYSLIEKAMNEACAYYSQYTDYNKHLNVYYNPGVPTADASYNGTIRFGQKAYMQKITAMHEIAHTFGVGTSPRWGTLMVKGTWNGSNANAALRELTYNPTAIVKGDAMHFWPYGLNYTSEVKSDNDLIIHCKIVNAMLKDGL
jgi:hypothetical protein